ncbi:MAG TPA: DUF4352 domain-containing protein [Armatimonadetes bacterium]|jgi:hypothetical protein|nr:DUF4352 domain-containing protein [Armatimonadota bacterium]
MTKRAILAFCLGSAILLAAAAAQPGSAAKAPAKKPAAKKPVAKPAAKKPVAKPAAKKPAAPAKSQGGAQQITAIEGEVGKPYTNRAYRIRFGLPRAAFAYQEDAVEQDHYWLIFPVEYSNATKEQCDFFLNNVTVADAKARVIDFDRVPDPHPLLPAAHGKGEVAFMVPKEFKPTKLVVQPNRGIPLRLVLPKEFAVKLPSTEAKLGEPVSNGLIRVTVVSVREVTKFKDYQLEEGHRMLQADLEVVNEHKTRKEIYLEPLILQDADGQQIEPLELPDPRTVAAGGKAKFTVVFQVEKEFKPASMVVHYCYAGAVPVTIKLP